MGLSDEPHGRLVGFPGFDRRVLLQAVVGLELHHRRGKVLGQPVVNLVGDDLPFVVAGLEHLPQRLPFLLQYRFGLPAFRRSRKKQIRQGVSL